MSTERDLAVTLWRAHVRRVRVAQDVDEERTRQDAKWGVQDHPDGTGGEFYKFHSNSHRTAADSAAKAGSLTWRHVLIEEMFEAFAETDPAKLREELVQCSAVCQSWCEAIDRRGDGPR